MKKQILLFMLILIAIFCKGQNEDKKWSFGLRTSAFIAHPLYEKNSTNPNTGIIDETANIGYGIDFFASRLLNKRLTLNFNLGFETEKYDFIYYAYSYPHQKREIEMISMRFPDVGLDYNFLLFANGAIAKAGLGISLIQGHIYTKYKKNPTEPSLHIVENYLGNHFFPYIRTGFYMSGKIKYGLFLKFNYNPLPDAIYRRNINLDSEHFYMKRYRFTFGLEFKI